MITLNDKQKEIYKKLLDLFKSEDTLQEWLSLPNSYFNNRPPIDFLLQEYYNYFDIFISK